MSQKISEFLKTPNGKLAAAVGALVLVWIIILFSYLDGLDTLFPDDRSIAQAKRELVNCRKSYEKALEETRKNDKLLKDYNQMIENAWKEDRHGMVDTEFRRLVSNAARSVELTLDSLGAVKSNRINADFYHAELDVSARANYEDVIKFFKAVEKITPKVTWRRVDIRPDRRPPWGRQQNQTSITARVLSEDNSTKATTRIGFNGTLRVIGFDGKIVPAKQKGGRK